MYRVFNCTRYAIYVPMIEWDEIYVVCTECTTAPWVRNLCTHYRMGWDLRSMYRVFNCTRYVIYVPMIEWDEIYVECTECTTAPWVRNLCTHDRMGWDLRSMYRVFNCTRYVIYLQMIVWDEIKEFEIELTRPTLPYDYTCFADGTSFVLELFRIGYCKRGYCTSEKYFTD